MNDKMPAPCEHCRATGLFGGGECRECDGKGYRLIIDGRVTPQRLERSGMIRRRTTGSELAKQNGASKFGSGGFAGKGLHSNRVSQVELSNCKNLSRIAHVVRVNRCRDAATDYLRAFEAARAQASMTASH
jgi:hypothetical protein